MQNLSCELWLFECPRVSQAAYRHCEVASRGTSREVESLETASTNITLRGISRRFFDVLKGASRPQSQKSHGSGDANTMLEEARDRHTSLPPDSPLREACLARHPRNVETQLHFQRFVYSFSRRIRKLCYNLPAKCLEKVYTFGCNIGFL